MPRLDTATKVEIDNGHTFQRFVIHDREDVYECIEWLIQNASEFRMPNKWSNANINIKGGEPVRVSWKQEIKKDH